MDSAGMLLDSESLATSLHVPTSCERLFSRAYRSRGPLPRLFDTLVRPLPAGCRLTCVLDSCHSGGVLDLPFIFVGTQENLASALAGEAAQMVMARNWLQDWRSWQAGLFRRES